MSEELLNQVVYTDYGQLTLEWGEDIWDGDADRFFKDQQNGLVGAAVPDNVVIMLARRSGGSPVRIVLEATEPRASADWEDVVEASFDLPLGRVMRWSTWAGESGGPLAVPPGQYRLRVSAAGRDAGAQGEFADEVVDRYLIELWPAPAAPDAVLRVGSDNAGYWHKTWGSRR
ncbi:hypothetical protein [Micromonospora cremea]|uniref:Uncharacterized protein n=1 Tax=Micromonospora cremea TaxID=709881 RepID=A0A1N5TNX6_9ACTN|nr:hypothetical protein [Micromonospora cremea]SIM49709.1 hypothetical protein SAMN04489832_0270 [Micromonospora cremea]